MTQPDRETASESPAHPPTGTPTVTPTDTSAIPVRLVIASVAMLLLLAALDQTIVSTALPTIVADLGGLEHLSWVVTAYILASTVSAPLYGKLGDLYGRKRMVFVSVGLFLLGSLLSGLSQSMTALIVSRAAQGLGGGGLFVLALSVIGDVVAPADRGKIQGMFAAVFSISSMVGPLIGGWFVENLSWHWIFLINLPVGLIAVSGFALGFPSHTATHRHKIDWAGAALLSIALATLTLLTSLGGNNFAWTSIEAYTLGGTTVLVTILFLWVEKRAPEPILPLTLFQSNVFRNTAALSAITGAAMLGAVTFLPLYLQVARGVTPTVSGLLMAPITLGIITATTIGGRYMRLTARYKLMPIIGLMIMIAGALVMTLVDVHTSITAFSGMIIVFGLGMGFLMPVLTAAVQNAVPRHQLGTATAGSVMFRQIGGSLAVAVFGAVLTAHLSGGGVAPAGAHFSPQQLASMPEAARLAIAAMIVDGIRPIFWVVAGLSVVGLIFAIRLEEIPLVGRGGMAGRE